MQLVLIHGMGRTPISMLLLRHRLRKRGYEVHLFGYSPTIESLERVSDRLATLIRDRIGARRYVLVGHSLGSVIIRHTLAKFDGRQPAACFFLAPPMVACRAAKFFSRFRLYRLATGEMGQLLAQDGFMVRLPVPENVRIYAGTGGPRTSWLPFRGQVNDGILSIEEATAKVDAVVEVPSSHTFIMNAKTLVSDMIGVLERL